MKFVKENLTLVICAAVAVLSVVAVFYPIKYALISSVKDEMATRYAKKAAVDQMAKFPLELRGATQKYVGVPSDSLIKVKTELITSITTAAQDVAKIGRESNTAGRLDSKGVPLLNGKPEPAEADRRFLPKIQGAEPMAYKEDYGKLISAWVLQLAGSADTTPQTAEKLHTDFDDFMNKQKANLPPGMVAALSDSAQNNKQLQDFQKNQLIKRAASLKMYVDPPAFHEPEWVRQQNPPSEQEIFESLVESWFERDAVNAISAVNKQALDSSPEKNVGRSPIKRLMKITVGNDAATRHLGSASNQTGGGGGGGPNLFMTSASGQSVDAAAAQAAAAPPGGDAGAQTTNYAVSMTGHLGGTKYDVVLMSIWMDIDPSQLNAFINELYRQNMGYSVLNIQTRTVDPLDRASNGYIYGDSQVVEVEILVEGIMFRDWTVPLMPEAIRTQLGVPPDAPKPPA